MVFKGSDGETSSEIDEGDDLNPHHNDNYSAIDEEELLSPEEMAD